MSVTAFMERNFRHFNARETLEAAKAYKQFTAGGGKMFLALAGAMSTAELGITLSKMIRAGQVHAISCTAANFEEDIFNLVSHDEYRVIADWRALLDRRRGQAPRRRLQPSHRHLHPRNRHSVPRKEPPRILVRGRSKERTLFLLPILHALIDEGRLQPHYQIDPQDSWVIAAHEAKIPIYCPGFEDSTLGNIFSARVYDGSIAHHGVIKSGTEQMEHLIRWYLEESAKQPIGFFQIAGGIAGDFAICAVPCIIQDLEKDVPYWSYFCQISDSTTSYGSYSGAVPNEKITWHKLDPTSPRFMINSDASIIAPLIFSYVLGE